MPESTSRNEDESTGPRDSIESLEGPSSHDTKSQKERRPPSITPRKFTRFFTPRTHGSVDSRKALGDITSAANNYNEPQFSPLGSVENIAAQDYSSHTFTQEIKRRKLFHAPSIARGQPGSAESSPNAQFHPILDEGYPKEYKMHTSPCARNFNNRPDNTLHKKLLEVRGSNHRIKQLEDRGLPGGLLQLSLGYTAVSRRRYFTYPISDWRDQTARFYSGSDDVHMCTGIDTTARGVPFCAASCNTNSLVAIGDEDGHVRLLESAKDSRPKFRDIFLAFHPHSNAIIDLCFSLDDSLLATASGDQTSRVIDMTTQTTISVLSKHSASLKQVRFQPGASNNSIIATSSRDGCVKIWDLRCKGTDSVQGIHTHQDDSGDTLPHPSKNKIDYSRPIGGIYDAHHSPSYLRSNTALGNGRTRAERLGRNGDISVTAVAFLPQGMEHLLLTGSEANASVKLWDVRSLHNTRRKTTVPLSCTTQPKSHTQWRHFGINSLSLSHDGSRFYTLCKDNTVYAYSVAHLILGQAPELSATSIRGRRQSAEYQEGLGPLYGFRHQRLHATSFYVKSAVRPARFGRVEMLAVGSCDGCTILFPTDEKYLQLGHKSTIETSGELLQVQEIENNSCTSTRFDDDITISYNGTPLVRGHDREVGALAWTPSGELITVGDDFLVRCWREGKEAGELRAGGEQCGRRWNCGWADVPSPYDDE